MCRHVVGAFIVVAPARRVLGRESAQEIRQIGSNLGRRVFLDQERGRSVPDEQRQQPGLDPLFGYPGGRLSRHVIEARPPGCDLDPPLRHPHFGYFLVVSPLARLEMGSLRRYGPPLLPFFRGSTSWPRAAQLSLSSSAARTPGFTTSRTRIRVASKPRSSS